MTRHIIDSAWTAVGMPGDALTVRNVSTDAVDLVFSAIGPSAILGDPADLWSLLPGEGAVIRSNQTALALWARSASGVPVDLDVFESLAVVSGAGFYELDPLADGATAELLFGTDFGAATAAHWTQTPVNAATIAHAADGMTMQPASASFADRAQVFQSFSTSSNATYTVEVVADEVPTSASCLCLVYSAEGGQTLIHSQPIAAVGQVTFNFTAASTLSEVHLRVSNTASPAKFSLASVKVATSS